MRKSMLSALLAATVMTGVAVNDAKAATPDDMLVIGMRLGDIITFDPAELFELNAGEMVGNIYEKVMTFEAEDLSTLVCGVCSSFDISDDGKTITFTLREGQTFHSGNPVRTEDVVWSLQRVIKLNKTPAFIFTQLGWTEENVEELVKVIDDTQFSVTITADLSPGLVLNALSAGVASVVDKELVMANEVDGDLGYAWLKDKTAASGPFKLVSWKANESVVLEANPNHRNPPNMRRVIARHVPEPAAQRLLLEQGDVDIARNLTPDQIAGLEGNEDVRVEFYPKATLIYMAANTSNEHLADPKVWEALRHLVDYEGMAGSFLEGQYIVHQTFWPSGLWASATSNPYSLDVEKAKGLLEEAGQGGGFSITIDSLNTSPYLEIAQSLQATLAEGGIQAEIVPQDGSALWPKYRARRHGLILAQWSPDYLDPHSNADSFARNPDNREEAKLAGVLAWRNAWADDSINALTDQASSELDLAKREGIYNELQIAHQSSSPFAVMFQQNEQVAFRNNVQGFVSGANFDLTYYRNVTK